MLDEPIEAGNLSVETMIEEDVTVISPPSHALASSDLVTPLDLSGETVLLPEAPSSGCAYRGQFERHLSAAGVVPQEKLEFQSIEAVKRCVAAGMGVSVLPTVAVEADLAAGNLRKLGWVEPFLVETRMVWNGERWPSPALKAFLDTARDVLPRSYSESGRTTV